MSSWSTLNKGITAAAKDAVELQVEKLLKTYQTTLKLHQKGDLEEAKQKYQELVTHDLVKKEPKPKKKPTSIDVVEESPLSTLRFLVFKNYGSLLKDEFDRNDHKDVSVAKSALQYYLQAVKIDPSEYSLWYHIGCLSQTLGQLRFARLAFENGFYVDRSQRSLKLPSVRPRDAIAIIQSGQFTPMQWKCLEALCQVLYDIGDYRLCTFYVNIILERHSTWETGHQLKMRMDKHDIKLDTKDTVMELQPLSIALEKPEWSDLVESLLKEYNRLAYTNNENTKKQQDKELLRDPLSKRNRLNDTYFMNRSIYITFEEQSEQEEPMDVCKKEDPVISTCSKPEVLENTITTIETAGNSLQNPVLIDLGESTTIIDMVDSVIEIMNKAQKRKREEDEDGDNSENDNDEEDEAEEKRLSLRASKRQREKIANEETSRLKMLEEEKVFTEKVQVFYNKVESIPMLYRKAPWYDESPIVSTHHFWDWFDQKVSELDSTYCWDIGTTKGKEFKTSTSDNKSSGSLSLFIPSYVDTPTAISNHGRIAAKNLIAEINSDNSGIVDSLYKLVSSIVQDDTLQDDSHTGGVMDNRFLESITDVITAIQPTFVQSIMLGDNQRDKLLLLLRVAEYFVDRLIRSTMVTLEETGLHPNNASNKRRVSTSFAKQSKLKMIEHLIELATYWIGVVEQNLYSLSLVWFSSNISKCAASNDRPATLSNDEQNIQLRYYVLKGKLAQCNNNIEEAYSWFGNCKPLFEESKTMSIDVKSMYDSFINPESITKKLDLLQVGKLFATSKQKMTTKDFEGVIQDLEEIVKPKLSVPADIAESGENMQMINMLAEAYYQSGRFLDAWNCYVCLFCSLMQRLINYGENQYSLDSRPSKNEDVEFLKSLGYINESMDNMVQLLQKKNKSEEWLPHDMNQELANKLVILLRMSTCYIFRHPDFVPLVNNFTTPDVPPHTPSKVTKSNGFNDIVIKSWVLQSRLIQHTLTNNTSLSSDDVVLTWAELLQELHDELGEREICGVSKSIFIHHLMETLTNVDDSTFRREIYQCYHCLYGVHLAAESSMIEEHHCTHSDMDQKASEPLFELVVHSAVEKLEGGFLLKNDLKDVIDTVSELFEELSTKHPLVKNNQTIIENYLNSEINLHPSLNMMLRTSIIPTNSLDPVKTNTSMVLYKIFWIRGKTLRIQIKNRAKANNEKNMIDLEKAIEEFTSHIILNPDDTDGWCELGTCYQHLADEELNWSASNIVAHKDLISEYQRKSFRAYMRGLYLGGLPKTQSSKNDLFVNFGNLLYTIASPPMNMEAFKTSSVKRMMGPGQSLVELRNQPASRKSVYKLATIMYNHALRYHTSDRLEWKSYYMTGKCLAKIDRPPKEVLNWYLQAIRRAKSKNEGHDYVLEPIYIFCSALVKYLYAGKLDAKSVMEFLDKEKDLQKNNVDDNADQEIIYLGNNVDNVNSDQASPSNFLMSELNQQTQHLPMDTANAYNAIFKRITDIRATDIKGWHHRPVYRIAWMYYYVYHNIEKAKAEIMKLVTFKANVKNHINIWKSGFELPGKHYEYINKYTLFTIELFKVSNDLQSLKHLYRKLRRGQTLILNDKKVFRIAYTAYLEIIKVHLASIHHAKDILAAVKASRIDKEKFEAMLGSYTKLLAEDKSRVDFDLYSILQDLAELRRLTQGFIPTADAEKDGLDDTIQMCFAAAVFGGINNIERMRELVSATSTTAEENPNHGKELLDVLLLQAKVMLINTITVTR